MRIFHFTGETLVLRESPGALRAVGALVALAGVPPALGAWRNAAAGLGALTLEQALLLAAGALGIIGGLALVALPRTTTCMVDRVTGTLRVVHRNALGADGWGCYLSSLSDVLLEPQFGSDGHTLYRITLVSASGRRIPLTSFSSVGVAAQMPAVTALRHFLPDAAQRRPARASAVPAEILDRVQWARVARFLSVAATALVVLVAGGALIVWESARESRAFRPVAATVLDTRVETKVADDGSVTRRPVVVYRYTVRGRVYTSERVTREERWTRGKSAFDVVNRYTPGARYTAFYDPATPGVAFLVKPHELARYPLALFPLVGLLLVARAIRAWLKRAPPPGPASDAPATESGLVFLAA